MSTTEWAYTIDAEKIRESRSALCIEGDPTEAPPGFLFSALVVPGLQRALIDPALSSYRSELRLATMVARWDRPLRAGTQLRCAVTVGPKDLLVITARDEVRTRVELEIGLSGAPSTTAIDAGGESRELMVDAGRSVAFAAATWDLNPAYWSQGFAYSAGLEGTVAPPGLAVAWAMQVCAEALGAHPTVASFAIDSTPRPPEKITATVHEADASGVAVTVSAGDRRICSGRCSLRPVGL